MKPRYLMLAGVLILGTAGPVLADCASELKGLAGQGGTAAAGKISKDGTAAPLQDPQAANGMATPKAGGDTQAKPADNGGGAIAKDGSNMPLNGTGGASADTAMSQQDVQAQQQGGQTAAEAAMSGSAMQRAQAALDAGDEAGCMKAVEELRHGNG